MSRRHRTYGPGTPPVHGRTLRREARTVSTALASLAAASMLSGSVVSFTEGRDDRAVEHAATVVSIRPLERARGAEVTAVAVEVADLGPGAIAESCVVIAYGDPAETVVGVGGRASLRLTGRVDPTVSPSTRASAFIEVGRGARGDCTDFVASSTVYAGDLRLLAAEHGSHAAGLSLMDHAAPGDTAMLRLVVSMPPGAAPVTNPGGFWLDVEARLVGV